MNTLDRLERFLERIYELLGLPVVTDLERAQAENAALKAIKRTRALEAENAELREELWPSVTAHCGRGPCCLPVGHDGRCRT